MYVRLVKQRDRRSEEEKYKHPNENKVRNAVQDWVKEFKARKAEPARIGLRQTPAES